VQFAVSADHVLVTSEQETVTLWRPTGPEELALVKASGWREWPLRLPGQPIFYPVLNEDYAAKIAAAAACSGDSCRPSSLLSLLC
jgi:hypothetical protein